ncbi:family 20 glycosylhydrolase [Arenibacter algicola]|uniref:beta-N-acetylhexosaminidase n=1 Tax=Arenibacter algicola TaxID=616991 RepID=UPI001C068BBB|nr:family 20 glycosylhydrolase [Arenibacter algicola]MBU2904100.1 family 20 glycosylhydrolase [Arenibacter algicola]
MLLLNNLYSKRNLWQLFKIFLFTISLCVVSCAEVNQKSAEESELISKLNIIPNPAIIKSEPGSFKLTSDVKIVALPRNTEMDNNVVTLLHQLSAVGVKLDVNNLSSDKVNEIQLVLNKVYDSVLGAEGYVLDIKPSKVNIQANKPAGVFYGIQSLIQLLPNGIENKEVLIPCVYIEDFPRFAWRGLLIDPAHYFLPKDVVMEYIDQMAKYKYNILQLHLANDNAWRIEIKAFPKLTEIGSWRVPRTGEWRTFEEPQPGEKSTYGGYYTQEELKELVKYAHKRNVTIVPGIEIPGHSLAMIASYPSTSCTGVQYDVNPGSPIPNDMTTALCAGNESNFEMLDKILDEYVEIFPSEYIHIGGDEVNKKFWKTCPKCQKRMKDENLSNEDELQSYFIHRVEKMLTDKGRKLVGWDEILEGGLTPDATVMNWRGMEGGIKAAQMKHDVVVADKFYTYFDKRQTDPKIMPIPANGLVRLSQVYKFEPVPDNVDPKYILGGQGCLWGEYISTKGRLEYMTWPRGFALSEVLWSPKGKRDLDEFITRVEAQFPSLERYPINYSKSIYDPIITPVKNKDGIMKITFSSDVKGLDFFYTLNGTRPDDFSNRYKQQPVDIPKGASQVWVVSYRDGKPCGESLSISIDELRRRLNTRQFIDPS